MISLLERIRREIAAAGPIPFARFMELALYCPESGYYERPEQTIGRRGDYFTSVSAGPLFGELLAFQFARWLDALACPPFQLVEAGAHDGQLALDVLSWFAHHRPDLLHRLDYWVLEPSARRRAQQAERLRAFPAQVRWFAGWAELAGRQIRGVIFCNELLDALAVHRLGWDATARQWFEWGVACDGEGFCWTQVPNSTAAAAQLVALASTAREAPDSTVLTPAVLDQLPHHFTIEVSPAAVAWWQSAAAALAEGKLVAFDYGCDAEQFFQPERAGGTLRAYYRHHLAADPLARPGEQDLTAHVNFTALRAAGEAAGLTTEMFTSQGRFLTRIAAATWAAPKTFPDWSARRRRQFQTLVHDEHLGRVFNVLVQSRRSSSAAIQPPKGSA